MNASLRRSKAAAFVCSAIVVLGCSSSDDHGGLNFDTGPASDSTAGDSGSTTDSHGGDVADAHDSGVVGDSSHDSGGGTDSSGGDSTTTDGSGGDSVATDATDSSTTIDTTPDAPPPDAGPPACDPTKDWTTVGDTALSALSTVGSDDYLGDVTPDELTIVWVTLSDPDVFVKVSDRSDTASAFGAPVVVSGSFGFTRVTVSGDGLTLIATDATRKSLVTLTRAARGDAFGSPDTSGFGEINALAFDGPTHLGDPTLSADGNHLMVTAQGLAIGSALIWESTKTGTAWGTPVKVTGPWTGLQRPSGYSFDARTIFLTDVTPTGTESFRPAIGFPFDKDVAVGSHLFASPTRACDKLYFSRAVNTDGTDLDLFVTD